MFKQTSSHKHTNLGVANRDGSPLLHQQSGNAEIPASECVMQRGDSLTQGPAGVVDVRATLQQHGHNICKSKQIQKQREDAWQVSRKTPVASLQAVTMVTVVTGLVQGSPATVVPGVHRVTLQHKVVRTPLDFLMLYPRVHKRQLLIKDSYLSQYLSCWDQRKWWWTFFS